MELLEIRKEIVSNLKGDFPDFVDKLNYFIIQKLSSKKNSVVKVIFNKPTKNFPKNIVIKIFRTNNAQKEYSELIKLKNQELTVPEVRRLLEIALPLTPRSIELRLAWSRWLRTKRQQARRSHYRRKGYVMCLHNRSP